MIKVRAGACAAHSGVGTPSGSASRLQATLKPSPSLIYCNLCPLSSGGVAYAHQKQVIAACMRIDARDAHAHTGPARRSPQRTLPPRRP